MMAPKAAVEHHYRLSSYREKTLEHVFIAECLKALWRRGIYDTEILRSEVDGAGYDLVFECGGIVRHIQLKSSYVGSKTARQKLNNKLAEKPSGCAIWMQFDPETLALGPFYWFGSPPGRKIKDLSESFHRARHTKGDSRGVKLPRENAYTVPKRCFSKLDTIDDVVTKLFGKAITS